ncbi:unnamed protein product [Adineta steineri]|uniref:F-box domain-containing protein n=1 Tax=Adineta steineri TaxID=433720 RepID=A0A819CKW0_9BILA|nr:unnamed protein product [Adineta steineri]CAF1281581.1 unnamed protein product [Adineta steineri]CAF3808496.1 unnamed protein product [Adineta steineri]CAF3821650.1 unnamed protein product [Adineta steineri]
MNLELIPDEVLLNIFQYVHDFDLLRAFSNLSYRFNFLLHNQYRTYCFNFNYLSKRTFDMICQQHLTFIADRTITLTLSDDFGRLRYLDIDTGFTLLNGYEWKAIIKQEVGELIDSYQTSFWTIEHQQFIRCFTRGTTIHLHTASSIFDYNYYRPFDPDSFKSTYRHKDLQRYYSTITHVYNQTCFDSMIPFHTRLLNIEYLNIEIPINDRFWSIVPNLNQLKFLTVSSYVGRFQEQLQALFDLALNLRCISVYQDEPLFQ